MQQKVVLTDREIAQKSRVFSVCAAAAFMTMIFSIVGMNFYTRHANQQMTVLMIGIALFSLLVMLTLLHGKSKLDLVSPAEMTSLYKAGEDIPAAKDDLCRILQVRQRVTKAEMCRILQLRNNVRIMNRNP